MFATRAIITLTLAWLATALAFGQERVVLEGYAYEDNNAGYLNEVRITVLDAESGLLYGEATTNREGYFALEVPRERDFVIRTAKTAFEPTEATATSRGLDPDAKAFVKLPIARAPGYRLEVTLAEERRAGQEEVRGITNSLIEVYNNTRDSAVLLLRNHPTPYFSFQLEQGNHYTLLIRTPGFFSKRIESFVNVDGCILCMDGVSEIGPGVSDNLAYGNDVGTLVANIELKPMAVDSAIALNNIYYDYNSAAIRPDAAHELDKVVELLRVNPAIVVELGSHTDSRGRASYNRELSQARAQSAVDYIALKGIPESRLSARGYGEDRLANVCIEEVECSEAEHARNRRTELKITGFTDDPFDGKSLAEIIEEEHMDALLAEVLAGGEIRIPDGGTASADATPPAPVDRVAGADAALDRLRGDLAKGKPALDPTSPEAIASASGDTRPPDPAELGRPTVIEVDRPTVRAPRAESSGPPPPESEAAAGAIAVLVPEQSITNASPLTMPTGAKFTGYRVLVFQSPVSLADANGELFFKYGTLREEGLADQTFGYMSGAFGSEPEARAYLDDVKGLFPGARLVRYVNGFIIENAQ